MRGGGTFKIAALLLALANPVSGQQQFYGDKKYGEFFEEEKKWAELETKLPAYPRPDDLLEFDAGAATNNRYFVDGATLSVGEDGIVRYVTVVKTAGGANNISFEGIRCGSKERKLFALGRGDGTWSRSRKHEWQPIRPGSYQSVLYKEYFCPKNVIVYKAEEGVDALRRGGHPEAR